MLPKKLNKYLRVFPKNKKDEKYNILLKKWEDAGFSQAYIDTFLSTQEDRRKVLTELDIDNLNSFYYYYLNGYSDPENMQNEFYADTLYGLEEIYEDYKNPFWGEQYPNIQDRYLRISSIEGEHSYFYDKETDAVYSVDWNQMDDLVSGKLKPQWESFYDFLEWYYGEDEEE